MIRLLRIYTIPLFIFLFYEMTLILSSLAFILVSWAFGVRISSLDQSPLMGICSFLLIGICNGLFWKKRLSIDFKKMCRFNRTSLKYLISALITVTGVSLLGASIYEVFGQSSVGMIMRYNNMIYQDSHLAWVYVILVVLVGPAIEEFVFRGILFIYCLEHFPKSVAVIISALLFSLIHADFVQVLCTLLLGVVFSILYTKTQSLICAILAHAFANSVGFIVVRVLQIDSAKLNATITWGGYQFPTVFLLSFILLTIGIATFHMENKK